MSECRSQLALYDVRVVALRGHGLLRKAVGDEVIHYTRKRSNSLRKYFPQLSMQFLFRRIDPTEASPLVLADEIKGRTLRINVLRQLLHW